MMVYGKKLADTYNITFPLINGATPFSQTPFYFNYITTRTSQTEAAWNYYNSLSKSGVTVMHHDEPGMYVALGF